MVDKLDKELYKEIFFRISRLLSVIVIYSWIFSLFDLLMFALINFSIVSNIQDYIWKNYGIDRALIEFLLPPLIVLLVWNWLFFRKFTLWVKDPKKQL